jgi:hypothetical protein
VYPNHGMNFTPRFHFGAEPWHLRLIFSAAVKLDRIPPSTSTSIRACHRTAIFCRILAQGLRPIIVSFAAERH